MQETASALYATWREIRIETGEDIFTRHLQQSVYSSYKILQCEEL